MSKTYSKEAEYVTVWARAQRNTRASEVIHIARIGPCGSGGAGLLRTD